MPRFNPPLNFYQKVNGYDLNRLDSNANNILIPSNTVVCLNPADTSAVKNNIYDFYIEKDGDDKNNGRSPNEPKKTFIGILSELYKLTLPIYNININFGAGVFDLYEGSVTEAGIASIGNKEFFWLNNAPTNALVFIGKLDENGNNLTTIDNGLVIYNRLINLSNFKINGTIRVINGISNIEHVNLNVSDFINHNNFRQIVSAEQHAYINLNNININLDSSIIPDPIAICAIEDCNVHVYNTSITGSGGIALYATNSSSLFTYENNRANIVGSPYHVSYKAIWYTGGYGTSQFVGTEPGFVHVDSGKPWINGSIV